MMYTGMVTNDPKVPTHDKRVRHAMNYAVDKEAISQTIFRGITKPYDGIFKEPYNNPPLKAYPYDPEKAKKLLKEAGYPNGFKIGMGSPQGRYIKDAEVAQVVARYLSQVGIKVDLKLYDWVRFAKLTKSRKAEYKLYLMGQGGHSNLVEKIGRTFDVRQSPWAFHGWKNKTFNRNV